MITCLLLFSLHRVTNCDRTYARTHTGQYGVPQKWPQQCFVIIYITTRNFEAKICTRILSTLLLKLCSFCSCNVSSQILFPIFIVLSGDFTSKVLAPRREQYRNLWETHAEQQPAMKQLFGCWITIIEVYGCHVHHMRCSVCRSALSTHVCRCLRKCWTDLAIGFWVGMHDEIFHFEIFKNFVEILKHFKTLFWNISLNF